MKRSFILFFIITLLVFLPACKKNEPERSFDFPAEMKIRVKRNEFETEGTVLSEEGRILFRHETEGSPLFGMEEILEGETLTVRLGEMIWNSNEICTPIPSLIQNLKHLLIRETPQKISEEENFVTYQISQENQTITVTAEKKDRKILFIAGKDSFGEYRIEWIYEK